jgi:hypothetical protein
MCFILGSAMISWHSMKHKYVSLRSAEAKYIIASDASIEAIWLCKMISGLFDHVMDSICDIL